MYASRDRDISRIFLKIIWWEPPSFIKRKVQFNVIDYFFSFFLRSSCMKTNSYEQRHKSARRGAQFVPIWMPIVCWKLRYLNVINVLSITKSSSMHLDNVSFRKFVVWIRVIYFYKVGCISPYDKILVSTYAILLTIRRMAN